MRVLLVKVDGEPTSEEAGAIVNDFKELVGSDVVLVIGDGKTADAVWDTLESNFGWRSLPPDHQGLIRQLLEEPSPNIPSQEELAGVRARVAYARSEPGRVRDFQSIGRPTPDWAAALQEVGAVTCDKPQGPPVKLMTDQPEGIHPPYAETYQRERKGLSMGCSIEAHNPCPLCESTRLSAFNDRSCPLCEDKDAKAKE